MRAVLDANVIVSGLINPSGPPGRILLRLVGHGAFELVVSPATLDELRRSLRYRRVRKYLKRSLADIDLWVDSLAVIALVVEGRVRGRVVDADPGDDIYIAAAVEGLADFIVSGDHHLLDLAEHGGIPIVTPRQFLNLLP